MRRFHPFWFLFYNLAVVPLFFLAIHLARLFNSKVREGVRGRRELFKNLSQERSRLEPDRRFIVIHCASAGEFEAARPLIEAVKRRFPNFKVHITCFSPSGMRPIKKAKEVESYSYLPFDGLLSVRRFFRILEPVAFLTVKHDVWPNLIWAAARRKIPTFWINANLHAKTKRLLFIVRGFNRSFLENLSMIMTVSDDHALRLARLVRPEIIEVVGDSRYDRTVARTLESQKTVEGLVPSAYCQGKKIIMGGSTWGPDQRIIIPAFANLKKEYDLLQLIMVPHELHQNFLKTTEYYVQSYGLRSILHSQLDPQAAPVDVLIVDKMGILAALYRLAWVAFVGGAFGAGVHSVLEPAAYGIPVCFGPRYYMSQEAQALIACGGANSVSTPREFEEILRRYIQDESTWQRSASAAAELVKKGCGAAERIVDRLERFIAAVIQER